MKTRGSAHEVNIIHPQDNKEIQAIKQVIQFMLKTNPEKRNNIELVLYKLREQQLTREKQSILRAKDQEITVQRLKEEKKILEKEKDDKIKDEKQKVQRLRREIDELNKAHSNEIVTLKQRLTAEKMRDTTLEEM